MRERDLVARLGGDEFVVVLTDVGGFSGAVRDSVDRVRDALAEPFADRRHDDGPAAPRSASPSFPEDGENATELLAHADRRMYADKGARNGSLR